MTTRRQLLALAAGTATLRVTFAQSGARPMRVGIMEFGAPPSGGFADAYIAALGQSGFKEPKTLQVERRYAQGNAARYGELLVDLQAARVDLVFTVGHDIAQIAKKVAPTLPVVTAGSEDPVLSGLIESYRRPGGNITGVTYLSPELATKRLELLKELLPRLTRVLMLWDPAHFDTYYKDMEPAASALGMRVDLLEVRSPAEVERLAEKGKTAEALFIVPSRMIITQARRICDLALAAKLPTISPYANFTDVGGLMSYGAVAGEMLRRAAAQSVRIFEGAKAGTLPFERAATFELVINKRTANALGLNIPQALLARADRIIE